jgi:hypothetical protein
MQGHSHEHLPKAVSATFNEHLLPPSLPLPYLPERVKLETLPCEEKILSRGKFSGVWCCSPSRTWYDGVFYLSCNRCPLLDRLATYVVQPYNLSKPIYAI